MADFTNTSSSSKVFESNKITGTATTSYPGTPQARWTDAYLLTGKKLTIHNRSATNPIVFRLHVQDIAIDDVKHEYPDFGDADNQTIAATTDAANPSCAVLNIDEVFYALEIYLKSAGGADFVCIATGQFI